MDGKPLIVVADKNIADRLLIKDAMDNAGFDATIVEYDSAEKLVEFVKNECSIAPPRFIVLDLDLPKMRGVKVLEYLQKNPAFCASPVIVFSSNPDESKKLESIKLGAIKFIAKSHTIKEYNELVEFMKSEMLRTEH